MASPPLPPSPDRKPADLGQAPTVASAPRVYDYFLGGKDNFRVDRMVGEAMLAVQPGLKEVAQANRAFLRAVVRFLVGEGVRQFLDLGCGLPTQGNVHEVAQELDPGARVAYIDLDPYVVMHGHAMFKGSSTVRIVQGDLRDPESVMKDPSVHEIIDFGAPVAVLFVAVLHFVGGNEDPYEIIRAFRDHTAPGSYLAVSHIAKIDEEVVRRYQTNLMAYPRQRAQVEEFFDGYDLVPPGVVALEQWEPGRPADQVGEGVDGVAVGGVGRKR